MIKALILDLDNTIYPAASIGHKLFKPFFDFLDKHEQEIGQKELAEIKPLLLKKAWQKVAGQYDISENLITQGNNILRELSFDEPMQPFEDYELVKNLTGDKYLVTMGFSKMQESKVRMLNLESDFKEVLINDPEKTEDTKKEIFESLLQKYHYQPGEVLVIGDDPDSEIKSGKALNMPTVLYDKKNEFTDDEADHRISNYAELEAIIRQYQ